MIQVQNIRKEFNNTTALDGISLKVEKGKVLGLLGPNGAGKTTLVNILTTLKKPSSGRASIDGLDVVDEANEVRKIIGLAGQYAAIDGNLTGRENLEMVAKLYHIKKSKIEEMVNSTLERIDLTDAANRPAKGYSGGMRRRLDLGASLLYRPKVLFLDEPTTGLDPKTRINLWALIREMVDDGTTLLLTTQYLEEADELADNIVVIDKGTIVAEGTSRELKNRLGSDKIEVEVASLSQLKTTAKIIKDSLISDKVMLDEESNAATFTVKNGIDDLQKTIQILKQSKIDISHINLARPSLDEVFLSLTSDSSKKGKQ